MEEYYREKRNHEMWLRGMEDKIYDVYMSVPGYREYLICGTTCVTAVHVAQIARKSSKMKGKAIYIEYIHNGNTIYTNPNGDSKKRISW